MTLTETLAPLVAHNDENVKNLAGLLADIDKALSLGQLTEQEYVNLMIIANNLKLVIEASTQQELLIMANQALKIVIEVAKTAKFI